MTPELWWRILDIVPATLLALIVTASWAAGFTLGATGLVLTRIILPARRRHRITAEQAALRNLITMFDALPQPKTRIPTTLPLGVKKVRRP